MKGESKKECQGGGTSSNVKSTFFQDRKLSFCCFRSEKDRMNWFFKQNYGSERNVFNQFSTKIGRKAFVLFSSQKIFGTFKSFVLTLKIMVRFETFLFWYKKTRKTQKVSLLF